MIPTRSKRIPRTVLGAGRQVHAWLPQSLLLNTSNSVDQASFLCYFVYYEDIPSSFHGSQQPFNLCQRGHW
jgi:hypothetical protein